MSHVVNINRVLIHVSSIFIGQSMVRPGLVYLQLEISKRERSLLMIISVFSQHLKHVFFLMYHMVCLLQIFLLYFFLFRFDLSYTFLSVGNWL